MPAQQDMLINELLQQPPSVALTVLALGVVYGFWGFLFQRPLLAMSLGGFAFAIGLIIAMLVSGPPLIFGLALGLLAIGMTGVYPKTSELLVGGLVLAWVGFYLSEQLALESQLMMLIVITLGGCGLLLSKLNPRTMRLVVTALQGAVLIVVGGAASAQHFLPSFGSTLIRMGDSWALMMPLIMMMFVVASWSFQTLHQERDMRMGAQHRPT